MRRYSTATFSLYVTNEDYSGTIPSRKDISETSTFTSCTFNSQGSWGGAIYFTGSGASLTVTDSVFTKCNTTTGHGGAIYCLNCGKISIKQSSFVECSSYYGSTGGGGIFTNGASVLPEITENTFLSCTGGQDGGGLYLYQTKGGTNGANLPVNECTFISCVATGYAGGANDADGGGLIYWSNDCTLGISDCLFIKCESKLRAGGSFVTINQDYFNNIIRFCFYSENTALNGTNTVILFNSSSTNLWSIIFCHSFTLDIDLTYSLAQNAPASFPNSQKQYSE